MWPFKKKLRQRRLEVRRGISSGRASYWERIRRAGGPGSLLLCLAFLVAGVLVDSVPPDPMSHRLGQYVESDIRARVSFKVPSQKLIEDMERKIKSTAPATFRLNGALIDEIVTTLKELPGRVKSTTRPSDIPPSLLEQFNLTDPKTINTWASYTEPKKRDKLLSQIESLRMGIVNVCVVKDSEARFQRQERTATDVILIHDAQTQRRPVSELIGVTEAGRLSSELDSLLTMPDSTVRNSMRMYLEGLFARGTPIYRYDPEKTQQDIDERIRQIHLDPPSDEYVSGQILVYKNLQTEPGRGRSRGLSGAELELLASEHRAYVDHRNASAPWRRWTNLIGRGGIVLLITTMLGIYIAHYQPRIAKNHWRGLALALLLLGMLVLSKVMVFVLQTNEYAAVFAVMFATLIVAIAYDQRFALAVGSVLSVLVVMMLREDFPMLIVLFAAVAGGAFQLREIRTRSKVMKVSVILSVLLLAVLCALGLSGERPWRFVLTDGAWACGGALLGGMVIQVMLPMIERIFRIATSMTLLEWCDASKPLLKRLATEAPGTWNHCLQLGAMCEAAAEAIGARGLLARVGAYYHDIGKINKPEYFVENQGDLPSKHDKLSPAMSLLIIVGHVKDGLEMAREYGLPPVLRDFITTHHGTTLVQYFYHAAAERRKDPSDRAPEEVEFRYPGPKPRSKETGILMLADAAESSARSMSEPTPGRIETQVRTVVNRRLMDGQLDECEMTLREVHQVEASLIKGLCSIYHARISYPTPTDDTPSEGESQEGEQEGPDAQGAKRDSPSPQGRQDGSQR